MESLSPQVVSAAKLPILNPNEFDLWKMRIKQYFLITDYSFWEVILNGDSPAPIRVIDGVLQPVVPTTAEQRLARKNELKAYGTLLMDLLDKHQLKFNTHKDAKNLMEAIEKSTNEPVSVAASVSVVSAKLHVFALLNVDSLSNDVIYLFFARQSNSPQLDNDDLKQIDADDLEEMDLKWQMAMLTVECYNYHRKGHFARECRSPKDTRRNGAAEPQRKSVSVETSTSNALVSQYDGVGSYDWSFQAKEEPTSYALIAFSSSSSSSSDNEVVFCSKACTKAYATLQSHYDKLTADCRKSQFDVISYQTGLEYVETRLLVYQQNESVFEEDIKLLKLEVQLKDNALVVLRQNLEKAEQERNDLKLKLEKFQTSSKNLKSDESLPPSPIYDMYQSGNGYHLVLPPYTGTFMPPKPDLVFNNASNDVETNHPVFNVELSLTKPDNDLSYTHRPSTPIIEDWVSDSEDEFETKIPQNVPSFVQSTEQVKYHRPSIKHVQTSIPTANYKTCIPKPTSNGKHMNRKACFVCKTLDHLIKDCDYHEKKMAQPTARNHAKRGTNKHYASMPLPNPQRHVVPTGAVPKSKLVPINAARPFTAAVPKISVTRPRQVKHVVTKPKSPPKQHINRSLSPKASTFPPKVTVVKN
nr:hypothetical protein [Tanacetum cinerariifolium]